MGDRRSSKDDGDPFHPWHDMSLGRLSASSSRYNPVVEQVYGRLDGLSVWRRAKSRRPRAESPKSDDRSRPNGRRQSRSPGSNNRSFWIGGKCPARSYVRWHGIHRTMRRGCGLGGSWSRCATVRTCLPSVKGSPGRWHRRVQCSQRHPARSFIPCAISSQSVTTQPLASAREYRLLSGHDSSPSFEPRAV